MRPEVSPERGGSSPAQVQRVYLLLILLTTLATSLIWGVNTLFLLDAGLDNTQAFAANAFFSLGQVLFEVPTGVVADTRGRRFSFLLGIPALLGAGVLGLGDATANTTGATATAVATLVSFVVGYASIAWLLRLVAAHRITAFVPYRLAVGTAVLIGVAVT